MVNASVTVVLPSFFTVRFFSTGKPTFSVCGPHIPWLLHCSVTTSSPLPKSNAAGLKLTLCAALVAVSALLPALLLILTLLEKLPDEAELNFTVTCCGYDFLNPGGQG